MKTFPLYIDIPVNVLSLMYDIDSVGQCYLVGGTVRDAIMGKESKDYDIECYKIDGPTLESILANHGVVRVAGKHFGVFKVYFEDTKMTVDVSLARRENKVGKGHHGFRVMPDPNMTIPEAASRRDFTINTFAYDPFFCTAYDPFDGKKDIDRKMLVATSNSFREDPLRVLRGMRFAGQFGFDMGNDTANMCFDLMSEYGTISRERIWGEWSGMLAKSGRPGKAIKVLEDTRWIDIYPEIRAMEGLEQDKVWHPESDVLTHTKYVMDEAAWIARRDGLNENERIVLVLAALCHDMGKPFSTVQDEDGRIRSPKHATLGVEPALKFMESIGTPDATAAQVAKLVQEHMVIAGQPKLSDKAIIKLASRLAPSNIEMLAKIIEADEGGRPPLPKAIIPYDFQVRAKELLVQEKPLQPFLMGRDFLALGVVPGPHIGGALSLCAKLQEDGVINSREEALSWLREQWLEDFLSVFI